MNPWILVVTDEPGWHGQQLHNAFSVRGWEVRFASLRDCGFRLDGSGTGISLPFADQRLPGGVFVRGVAGGTLEEVVLRLDILHALHATGIPVYNEGRAIERTVDKAMTSFLLQRAGVHTPSTWVVSDPVDARQICMREHSRGQNLVCKPIFGSQGRGILRLRAGDPVPDPSEMGGVYYLQRMVDTGGGWFDWRVMVIGGRAVAAMRREADDWITNVAQGATCHPAPLTADMAALAERAVDAVGAQYGGVDLMRDHSGKFWVLEVNGIPAWRGLQAVCDFDLAEALADDFLARVIGHTMPTMVTP